MIENPLQPAQHSVGRLISNVAARAQQVLGKKLEPHGVTPQQWVVLVVLWWQDEISVSDLAIHLRTEKPAVSRLVDRMEKAGLVIKTPSETDRRSIILSATEKAKEKKQLRMIYEEINAVLLAGFSDEEIEQLFSLLRRVQRNADQHVQKN